MITSLLERPVKNSKVIMGVVLLALLFAYEVATATLPKKAYAQEAKKTIRYGVDIKIGGMEFTENEICEGHKSWISTELNVTWSGEKFKVRGTIEYAGMGEPVDEDAEMLHNIQCFSTEGSYHFITPGGLTLYPFAGVSFNRWLRNENPKYEKSFGELLFFSGKLGIGVKYRNFYAEFGGSLPFWAETNYGQSPSGKMGLIGIIGVEWKKLNIGILYEQTSFKGDGVQPSSQMDLCALKVGLRF